MSLPQVVDDERARRWRIARDALLAVSVLLAVVLLGIWFLLPVSEPVPGEPAPALPLAERPFSLTPHASPRSLPEVKFQDGSGASMSLADFRGRVVLLNLWATWCAPCRLEMPTLDRLQAKLGSADFQVVALSIDRDGAPVVRRFFDETGVRSLSIYVDPSMEVQSALGAVGIPTTLLVDRQGREVARLTGPAAWDRAEAVALIERYLRPGSR